MQRPRQNMGLYYHSLSKDTSQGGKVVIPADISKWPENWTEIEYKEYDNAKKIKLISISELPKLTRTVEDLLLTRTSRRDFKERNYKVTILDLSYICGYGCGLKPNQKSSRMYPSGGARYSLEVYIYINRSDEIERGMYHYNVQEHSLELIESYEGKENLQFSVYEWAHDASCFMFITSIFDRNMRKYGERGYRYILLEAGCLSQNIHLISENLTLLVCGVGGTMDVSIENMLSIDGKRESLIFGIAIG